MHKFHGLILAYCCVTLVDANQSLGADPVPGATIPADARASMESVPDDVSSLNVSWTQYFSPTGQSRASAIRKLAFINYSPQDFFAKTTHKLQIVENGGYYSYRKPAPGNSDPGATMEFEFALHDGVYQIGNKDGHIKSLINMAQDQVDDDQPLLITQDSEYLAAAGYAYSGLSQNASPPGVHSAVLSLLNRGGTLINVATADTDAGSRLVIELETPNIDYLQAQDIDIDAVRKEYESTNDPPDVKEKLLNRIIKRKQLPATLVYQFELDPARDYVVTGWRESYPDKGLRRECKCSEFTTVHGISRPMPTVCRIDGYESEGEPGTLYSEPIVVEVFETVKLSSETVTSESLALNYKYPGTRVRDETFPEAQENADGAVFYTVPSSHDDLDAVIAAAREGETYFPGGVSNFHGMLILNLIAVLLIGGGLWFYRKRT